MIFAHFSNEYRGFLGAIKGTKILRHCLREK